MKKNKKFRNSIKKIVDNVFTSINSDFHDEYIRNFQRRLIGVYDECYLRIYEVWKVDRGYNYQSSVNANTLRYVRKEQRLIQSMGLFWYDNGMYRGFWRNKDACTRIVSRMNWISK